MKNRMKFFTILLILILLMLVIVPTASAVPKKQYGILIDVEETGEGPDSAGRYEYIITMEINGQIIYLTMWMTPDQSTELNGAIGNRITIEYYWDGQGHRIYIGFKYGDHTDHHIFVHIDDAIYEYNISPESAQSIHSSSYDNTVTDHIHIDP